MTVEQLELPLLVWGPPGTETNRTYMRRYMRLRRAGRRIGRKAYRRRTRPGHCAVCGHAWPLESACSMCLLPSRASEAARDQAWMELMEVVQ